MSVVNYVLWAAQTDTGLVIGILKQTMVLLYYLFYKKNELQFSCYKCSVKMKKKKFVAYKLQ